MIGDQLGDSYKQTIDWYNSSIKHVEDVSEFYRERAAIERESALKLQQLASKYFEKKAAVSSAVSVGPTPATTAGSLENGSLTTWTEILNQTEQMAQQRRKLADNFINETVAELGQLALKWQGIGEKVGEVHSMQSNDLSKCISAVKSSKSQYDEACASLEKSRAKGSKKIDQKEEQMITAKNSYLLAIAIGNRIQQKHFYDDEPELLDALESAQKSRTSQLNRIWKHAAAREIEYCNTLIQCLKLNTKAVEENNPMLDISMFVKHNTKPWPGPTEMVFTPSPVWHDEPDFETSDTGLRYLRARLSQADSQVGSATDSSKSVMESFESTKSTLARLNFDEQPVNQVAPVVLKQLGALKMLVAAETKRVTLETELETIEQACRGKDLSSVPVTRTKTKRTVFGKKKEVVEVVDTSGHTSHGGIGIKSLLARAKIGTSDPTAHVLYNFEAGADGELSVFEGETLVLVERDDGSGWVTLRRGQEQGAIPASYCEVAAPAPPPSRSVKTVTALYDFQGQDETQLSISKGDVIQVTEDDPGNGWTTGTLGGHSGIFPTSYVQ